MEDEVTSTQIEIILLNAKFKCKGGKNKPSIQLKYLIVRIINPVKPCLLRKLMKQLHYLDFMSFYYTTFLYVWFSG